MNKKLLLQNLKKDKTAIDGLNPSTDYIYSDFLSKVKR